MNARDFCFWLQGHFEMNPTLTSLDQAQTDILKKHLALAFVHDIDPSMGPPEHQTKLDEIHHGPTPPRPGDFKMRC